MMDGGEFPVRPAAENPLLEEVAAVFAVQQDLVPAFVVVLGNHVLQLLLLESVLELRFLLVEHPLVLEVAVVVPGDET